MKNIEHIRKDANNHRIDPNPQLWERLDVMLNATAQKKKVRFYQKLSIAALIVSAISVAALLYTYLGDGKPELFASNSAYQPLVLEDLGKSDDPIFNISRIHELNEAYTNLGFQD